MENNGKYLGRILFFVILLAAILGLLLLWRGWYSSSNKPKTSLKIGISVYKNDDTFIKTILQNLEDAVKNFEKESDIKIDMSVSDAKENQTTQNEEIKKFISLGYDVICVNIVDRTSASDIIDSAMDAGIPLIFFNREPVEEDIYRGENIYYVGSDAKETAILQGEIISDAFKNNPELVDLDGDGVIKYVMLEGESGHQDALIRTEWSVKTLNDAGVPIEKLTSGVANWERSQAAALLEQWLDEYGNEIELVICNNDDMALGALDAMKKKGYYNIKAVGVDGTPQGLSEVNSGTMLGTVMCNSVNHAEAIFKLAYSLGMDGSVPEDLELVDDRYVRVQLDKYTKDSR